MTVIFAKEREVVNFAFDLSDGEGNRIFDVPGLDGSLFIELVGYHGGMTYQAEKKGDSWVLPAPGVNSTGKALYIKLNSEGWYFSDKDGNPWTDGDSAIIRKNNPGWDTTALIIRYVLYRFFCTENPIHGMKTISGSARRLLKKMGYKGNKYYVLSIKPPVPKEVIKRDRDEPGYRVRLHECRGHWRRLKGGRRVWVRAHYRGDKSIGVVRKDYEVAV